MEINLLLVCANAFLAVMLLLSALAFLMRILITLFPEKPPAHAPEPAHSVSAPLAAAIQSAVHSVLPGARVTRIDHQP
ncbi:MAG TPA: hypothetical protein PKE55_13365 [Kiritimatiellia bacterium]|nr:hypothetical protein [Kiritimatiellia bacterium]